ncbi:MAG: SIMPL domain-containing protein [Chloroflexi bacterium]|nr:SIMPL domain-containing protein [Chloroflexota bacterium]
MDKRWLLLVSGFVLAVSVLACTQAPAAAPTTGPGVSSLTTAPGGAPGGAPQPQLASLVPPLPQAVYGGQQVGITVSGTGRVTVTPDLAILSLGVEARARTVQQARDQAAEAMRRVMDALKQGGLADKDIQTQVFNIQPEYVWNEFARRQEITGYRVTNTVTAKARKLDTLGTLVDQAAEAGGDLVRINGIGLTAENPAQFEAQARELAVKDAVAKAQQFARLTGVALGKLVYIAESGGFVPVIRDVALEAKALGAPSTAPPSPISAGEMDVSISVQAVFNIA